MELLTAAQMRAIEHAAIESGEVTGLELMERAGRGVVEAIFEEWPELQKTSHRAVVLCGPGNNGGDGFVVARLLKEWGWEVEVFLYGDPSKLPPDARVNYERWGELGETLSLTHTNLEASGRVLDLVVDAIFGTGLTRSIPWELADAVRHYAWTHTDGVPVVAVDMPSGVSSDTGRSVGVASAQEETNHHITTARTPGEELECGLTVSFHAGKVGHFVGQGPMACNRTAIASIGLEGSRRPPGDSVMRVGPPSPSVMKSGDHKYTHGHALILTGGPGKTGAARLTARGALRIGAGLVTLACPQNALVEVAAQVTAIMTRPLDGAPGLREALGDERLNALCLGPGMGLGADTQALVLEALRATTGSGSGPEQGSANQNPAAPASEPEPHRPAQAVVLDADALTRFERNPQTLFNALHENCVLTPHTGEFRRLFPDIAEKLDAPATKGPAYSKVDATREAAARAGCTVLFKGPDTVIADQTGRCSINSSAYDRAAPWLATAGSGDVLAGFITGLLARGFPPMQAAETAAWLHTECALSFGPGLIAEDLPEELPKVLSRLLT